MNSVSPTLLWDAIKLAKRGVAAPTNGFHRATFL